MAELPRHKGWQWRHQVSLSLVTGWFVYMYASIRRQQTQSSFAQEMAWRLAIPEPLLTCCRLEPQNLHYIEIASKYFHSTRKDAFGIILKKWQPSCFGQNMLTRNINQGPWFVLRVNIFWALIGYHPHNKRLLKRIAFSMPINLVIARKKPIFGMGSITLATVTGIIIK